MKIVFATMNNGKLKEIRAMCAGSGIEIVGAQEVGAAEDVVEDGKTLEENALKKARAVFRAVNTWTAADDTGLFIDALHGEPGIYAARWPGLGGNHAAYALERMKNIPKEKRTARFITVVAFISPDGKEYTFEGSIEGSIASASAGEERPQLPYDVVFIPRGGDGRTFAEMTDDEKNAFSHRANAIGKMKKFLKNVKDEIHL